MKKLKVEIFDILNPCYAAALKNHREDLMDFMPLIEPLTQSVSLKPIGKKGKGRTV